MSRTAVPGRLHSFQSRSHADNSQRHLINLLSLLKVPILFSPSPSRIQAQSLDRCPNQEEAPASPYEEKGLADFVGDCKSKDKK